MRKIVYTPHLEFRLKFREIPVTLPKRVFRVALESYFDVQTAKSVKVGRARYKGKMREFAVIYEEEDMVIKLITIHPLKPEQKTHRVQTGRWRKLD